MIKIRYDAETVKDFIRFKIYVSGRSGPEDAKVSAILYLRSRKEYVFMPDVTYPDINTAYPEKSINYLTHIGKGEYQFFFYPDTDRPVRLRILAGVDDVVTDKSFRIRK